MACRRAASSLGIPVIGGLFDDDGKRHVPQADGHLHQVFLAKRHSVFVVSPMNSWS